MSLRLFRSDTFKQRSPVIPLHPCMTQKKSGTTTACTMISPGASRFSSVPMFGLAAVLLPSALLPYALQMKPIASPDNVRARPKPMVAPFCVGITQPPLVKRSAAGRLSSWRLVERI